MKKITIFITLVALLFGGEFVVQNDATLLDKTEQKIEEMAAELKAKTGVSIYVYALSKLDEGDTITTFTNRIASDLDGSYALLTISRLDRQVEFKTSKDLEKLLDKDDVLHGYIIPLLVEIRKDVSVQQQISAGVLNGVGHIQDTVAEDRGVFLETSIGSESKNFIDGLMWVIKAMILLTAIAFFLAWRRSKV